MMNGNEEPEEVRQINIIPYFPSGRLLYRRTRRNTKSFG